LPGINFFLKEKTEKKDLKARSFESIKKLAKRDRHVATLLAMTYQKAILCVIASPGGAWQSRTSNR